MSDETNQHPDDEQQPVGPESGEPRDQQDASAADDAAEAPSAGSEGAEETTVSDEDLEALLDAGERDLLAEYRDIAARAQAELQNFRTRVERDRQANREAVIAEVIRGLLPAIDDLDRAQAHGDLEEGTPLAIVAQKLRGGFEKHGLRSIGAKGEPFDPNLHEALVQLPIPGTETQTVHDVIETGYALGDRLIRAAKVAVAVPAE
jgi:molecular chaperone GrpE